MLTQLIPLIVILLAMLIYYFYRRFYRSVQEEILQLHYKKSTEITEKERQFLKKISNTTKRSGRTRFHYFLGSALIVLSLLSIVVMLVNKTGDGPAFVRNLVTAIVGAVFLFCAFASKKNNLLARLYNRIEELERKNSES